MTSGQSTDREPETPTTPMNHYCLMGIVRTRGGEAARRRSTRVRRLVDVDPVQQPPLAAGDDGTGAHGRTFFDRATNTATSRRSVSNVSSCSLGRTPNSHHPPGRSASATSDRSWRRKRLRAVAGPTARLIENATRGGVAWASSRTVHHSVEARNRVPSRNRRANVCRPRIRQFKPTDGCGPWRGGP
jgi:hypothetical protein